MQPFFDELYDTMVKRLNEFAGKEVVTVQMAAACISICRETLGNLKRSIRDHDFDNKTEEIKFFKTIYPRFYSAFIYYVKVFMVETNRPPASYPSQIKYLNGFLDQIQFFFQSNIDFYQYIRTSATHFDEYYFVRSHENTGMFPDDLEPVIDTYFCTAHSLKAAKILADEQLLDYINRAIELLEKIKQESSTGNARANKTPAIQWTGTKVALIELIYSLHSAAVFNNGRADIIQIASYFETIFDIELIKIYHTYQEIRMRKKNRSSFLDLLRDRLIQRMDEADEGM